MIDGIKEFLDIVFHEPVIPPTPLPSHFHGLEGRLAWAIPIGVWMEMGFHQGLQVLFGDHLRDAVSDSRNAEYPCPAGLLRYAYRSDRRRKVTPRRHPVPDLIQVVFEVALKVCKRHGVHSRRPVVCFDSLISPPHRLLGNRKGLCFVHRLLPSLVDLFQKLGDPGPSLPRHYSGFLATTPWSVPVSRLGTQMLVGPPLASLPSHRDTRFPRSTQKPMSRSRRLHAGHRLASKQVPRETCPR